MNTLNTPELSFPAAVSLFDARPFFEKALIFGMQHGILDRAKLDAICVEAPKGMVQIARYFDNEYLRPDLEKARVRLVNLVSLYLQDSCEGDLWQAAESLRDHSLLSRSKGGAEMLKALFAMPEDTHFGMHEYGDKLITKLAEWSLMSFADYQAQYALRSRVALAVDAALWLAGWLGMSADDVQNAVPDAEAVIRTALLATATRRTEMPDWVAFEEMILALRNKAAAASVSKSLLTLTLPKDFPDAYRPVVESVWQSVQGDLPKITNGKQNVRKLFAPIDQTPTLFGRYFWIEDALSEVSHYDRTRSAAWDKLTQGHSDDGSLLTMLLSVAVGSPPKTLLTEKAAATLIRKIRKNGLQPELARTFIQTRAPEQHQDDYVQLWQNFIGEAQSTLQSDRDSKLGDALALLRRECNVSQ